MTAHNRVCHPIPKALYPCSICWDECSWPADYLFWHEGRSGWVCDDCNCEADEGDAATSWSLADEIKKQAGDVKKMTDTQELERLIIKQQLEIERQTAALECIHDAANRIHSSLCCVSGPLNGNLLSSAKQRRPYHAIMDLTEVILSAVSEAKE